VTGRKEELRGSGGVLRSLSVSWRVEVLAWKQAQSTVKSKVAWESVKADHV
jgi:hypothetical protein